MKCIDTPISMSNHTPHPHHIMIPGDAPDRLLVLSVVGLGLEPKLGSVLSGRGAIQQELSCDWVGSLQEYPRELLADGLISCDMIGVAPGDETLALPGGDLEYSTVSATEACCRCGGGTYIEGGAE